LWRNEEERGKWQKGFAGRPPRKGGGFLEGGRKLVLSRKSKWLRGGGEGNLKRNTKNMEEIALKKRGSGGQ